MVWIILWILAFIVLIIVHEFWHFMAAKKSWVNVKEFWLWLPPKIKTLRKDKSWTEYTINWIPLGWFVQLKWEDWTNDEEIHDKDSFMSAKLWKKLIIVLAWITMNFITAWLIFTICFSIWVKPMRVLPEWLLGIYSESYITPTITFLQKEWLTKGEFWNWEVLIEQVIENWVADNLWIREWTKIVSINDIAIDQKNLTSTLDSLENTKDNKIVYTLSWSSEEIEWNFECWDNCKLWIVYNTLPWDFEVLEIKYPVWKAAYVALKEIKGEWNLTMDTLKMIGNKIWNWKIKEAFSTLSWPVAIVKVWQVQYESAWFLSFFAFIGMISVALAIMNLLPIPALDWWRFRGLIIQKVFNIDEKKYFNAEWYVNWFFFWALMIFWVIIMIKDTQFWWLNIPFFN